MNWFRSFSWTERKNTFNIDIDQFLIFQFEFLISYPGFDPGFSFLNRLSLLLALSEYTANIILSQVTPRRF